MLGDQVLTIYRGRLDFRDAEFSEAPVIAKLPPGASAILDDGLPESKDLNQSLPSLG